MHRGQLRGISNLIERYAIVGPIHRKGSAMLVNRTDMSHPKVSL